MGHHFGNTTYQCLNCRLAQRAEVKTAGSQNIKRLRGVPRTDANTSMAMLLALKRCPRCGHFDRNVAKNNRHTVRVALIFYTLIIGAIGLTLYFIPGVPLVALIATMGILVLGFGALLIRVAARHPTNVESRVTLLGNTPMNQNWW
jgi:hypothetical protein